MSIRGYIDGKIVADPEFKQITEKFAVLELPLYSNRRVKNRESGEWENDPKGTTKLKVIIKFDLLNEWNGKLNKGDVIKVTGSFFEREYEGKNGTGRSLETDFIESIEVIKSASENAAPAVDNDETPW